MSWRTILVQQPAKLRLRQRQLMMEAKDSPHVLTLPLEDVAVVILETPQATITSALLSAMADQGIALITCDETHQPNGLLSAFSAHHRQLQVLRHQLAWSEPFKKRCWQAIVRQKLTNQATVLTRQGATETADYLQALVDTVPSGDITNREAVGAKRYWAALRETGFTRRSDTWFNGAINYGYAVVRSILARQLVAAGLLPCLGLHHANELNAFNLADDLLEPFRPWVDRYVLQLEGGREAGEELSVPDRQILAALATESLRVAGELQGLLTVCEMVVDSLVRATRQKEAALLQLPALQ